LCCCVSWPPVPGVLLNDVLSRTKGCSPDHAAYLDPSAVSLDQFHSHSVSSRQGLCLLIPLGGSTSQASHTPGGTRQEPPSTGGNLGACLVHLPRLHDFRSKKSVGRSLEFENKAVKIGIRALAARQRTGQDTGQDPVPLGAYAGNEIIHAGYRETRTGKLHVRHQQADTNFDTLFYLTTGTRAKAWDFPGATWNVLKYGTDKSTTKHKRGF